MTPFVAGGANNVASGEYSMIVGGDTNMTSAGIQCNFSREYLAYQPPLRFEDMEVPMFFSVSALGILVGVLLHWIKQWRSDIVVVKTNL